jgi:hypothetical protein
MLTQNGQALVNNLHDGMINSLTTKSVLAGTKKSTLLVVYIGIVLYHYHGEATHPSSGAWL